MRVITRHFAGGPYDRRHEAVAATPQPTLITLYPPGDPTGHRYELTATDPDKLTYRYVGPVDSPR